MSKPPRSDQPSRTDHAQLYELLVAELTDFAVFLTDSEAHITSWHPGVERLLGYGPNEWIGLPIHVIFTPEDQAAGVPDREVARACQEGRAPDVRWHRRKDGTLFYVEGTLVALKDGEGKVLGLSKVMRDITVRKRAEDSLRRSERRQALLLQVLREQRETAEPASIMLASAESLGRHLNVDRSGFFEMPGDGAVAFTAGWTAGRLPILTAEYPAAEIGPGYLEDSHAARITGTSIVAPIVRKGRLQAGCYVNQGERRDWADDEVTLVREVANLTWDAVERARGEASRRTTEERLALALKAAEAVGTWDWNVKDDLVYCSGRFAQLFSIDPASAATGVPITRFMESIHPDDRAPTLLQLRNALESADAFSADYRVVRKDGSERWVHALGHAYHDASGQPERFPGLLIDITERKEMERALRRSEELSRRVLESTRDCIKILDLNARLISINRNGQRELAIDDFASVANTCWLDFWKNPADRVAVETALDLARRGQEGQFEGYFATMRGEPRWWDVRVTPILDADGRPERLLAVSRDITERKRAVDEISRARDEAHTILESITDGFYALNREWQFIYFNAAAEQVTGFRRDNLLGKDHWELFAPVLGPFAEHEYRRAVREGISLEFENYCAPLQRWLALRLYPTQDGGLSVYFRDVTQSREKDEELRRQWHMFDTMLAQTPDHANIYDLDCRWVYANEAVLTLLRKPLEQVAGRKISELLSPPETAAGLERQARQVIATGQPLRDEIEYAGANGVARIFEYSFNPIFGAGGKVEAVSSSARDITERRRNEELERNRQEHFRESARLESLGIMAGGIAHDFNNLLVGVLGNASLLEETLEGGDKAIASDIMLAARRAAELTRQMLAYSGKGRFVIEVVDLNRLIRENLTLLRASLSKNVSVELSLHCEDCFVEGDASQIQQIVMNLLINASEAVGDRAGEVTIRTSLIERNTARFSASLHDVVSAGRYALLEVGDNGAGMQPETVRKIFDPFFTTKFTGRGLGLAAVLGIVKGHRGDIEVDSHPGHGTLFRVYLPAHRTVERPVAGEPSGLVAAIPEGQTVLVIDDEEVVRKMAATALQSRGFRVIEAVDGKDALDKLAEETGIAVVILDLTMPVMTGEQALPMIRKLAPDVPVILSSGFSQMEIQRRFAASGIAGVLQKPYTVFGILDAVTRALSAPG